MKSDYSHVQAKQPTQTKWMFFFLLYWEHILISISCCVLHVTKGNLGHCADLILPKLFITHDEAQVKSQSVYFVNPRGSYVKKKNYY